MNLLALAVQFIAILAQPISAGATSALRLGYVSTRRTCAVVVMDALIGWFLSFVDGIEFSYFRHRFSFCFGLQTLTNSAHVIKRIPIGIKITEPSWPNTEFLARQCIGAGRFYAEVFILRTTPKKRSVTNQRSVLTRDGNDRRARVLPPPKVSVKKKVFYASVFPNSSRGRPLPERFAKFVRTIEDSIKMPVWLLIQNGSADYCCSAICPHALTGFQNNRFAIEQGKPVALLIDSPGGDAHHAYSIARFFQRRTRDFTVLVPRYAKSAATLLALGASSLILGRDAELGPLDVQMQDREREEYGSALDAVQSLERLNVFSLAAIDQLMLLMTERTGKRTDTLLPLVFDYATSFVRPLLEKIDTVDYTKKSRELKVAEEYAVRLMQENYPFSKAKQIAAHLVEKYPTHGFVIDRQEAEANTMSGETYGLGLKITSTPNELENIFEEMQPYLDSLAVIGKLEEIEV